jgi:hypothetical protein
MRFKIAFLLFMFVAAAAEANMPAQAPDFDGDYEAFTRVFGNPDELNLSKLPPRGGVLIEFAMDTYGRWKGYQLFDEGGQKVLTNIDVSISEFSPTEDGDNSNMAVTIYGNYRLYTKDGKKTGFHPNPGKIQCGGSWGEGGAAIELYKNKDTMTAYFWRRNGYDYGVIFQEHGTGGKENERFFLYRKSLK